MTLLRCAGYVAKQVTRHRVRSGLTVAGVAIAMFLFTAVQAMHRGVEEATNAAARETTLIVYRETRYCPATSELPDHLPMLLEFLATRPAAEAREMLEDAGHILEALAVRLNRRSSPYAAALRALVEIAGARPNRDALAEMLEAPDDDPNDFAALDAVWEETEVTFGPDPNAGCPQVRDMLAKMDKPAPGAASRRHAAE